VDDLKASAGQAAELPVQFSVTSHAPAAARHSVPNDFKASAGQAAEAPVQFSATSHPPAVAARHSVPNDFKASAGQAAEVPVQYSATSQPPAAAARQTVVEDFKTSAGQGDAVPLHVSAASQTPAAARQIVPGGFGVFEQVPALQTSLVHALPSSAQSVFNTHPPVGTCVQTPRLHESVVPGSSSSQSLGTYEHTVPERMSMVQRLLSLQLENS
jgi:hypothetical protein